MSALVSVISAVRNPEEVERVEAMLAAQTYPNLELVAPELGRDFDALIDDGSTGSSSLLVGTYMAHGDFFAYVMPGDVYRPDHIALLVDLIQTSRAHFVYSQLGYGGDAIGGDPPRFGEVCGSCLMNRANLILAENWRDGGKAYDWDLITRWLGIGAKWAFLPRITVDRPVVEEEVADVPALAST